MRDVAAKHVETVLVRAGEWAMVRHGLDSRRVIVTVGDPEARQGAVIGVTLEHLDSNTLRLTLGGFAYRSSGTGDLRWYDAVDDMDVEVVVMA